MRGGILVVLLVGGCSLARVKSPAQVGPEKCTSTYGNPIVDTVVVAAATGLIINGADDLDCGGGEYSHTFCGEKKGFQLGLIVGIPYAISAAVGYTKVARCNAAQPEPSPVAVINR